MPAETGPPELQNVALTDANRISTIRGQSFFARIGSSSF